MFGYGECWAKVDQALEREALDDWVPQALDRDRMHPIEACVHLADLISTIARVVAFPAPEQE